MDSYSEVKHVEASSPNIVPGMAWAMLGVVFFSSLAAPINQFKAPPVLAQATEALGVSLGAGGWLMSVFSVVGMILALPSGFILGRIGVKRAGMTALAFLFGGGLLGAVAGDMPAMLVSRVLEGVGMCLLSIVAPTALAAWFPPQRRGLAMGIWGTWVPLSSILAFAASGVITARFGWKGMWWASLVYTGLVMALFFFFFRMPRIGAVAGGRPPTFTDELGRMKAVIKRADPWRLALSFACYNGLVAALVSFMVPYLTQQRLFSENEARFWVTCLLVVNMLAALGGGVLSDALGTRRKCLLVPYAVLALVMLFYFQPGYGVVVAMLLVGGVSGLVVTPSLSSAPEVVDKPDDAGKALSVLAVGMNGGMFFGPALFGMIVDRSGWEATTWFSVPLMILAFAAAWRLRLR